MTPDEVIEILQELHDISHDGKDPDWRGALKFSIGAVEQIKRERERHVGFWRDKLPGETEK